MPPLENCQNPTCYPSMHESILVSSMLDPGRTTCHEHADSHDGKSGFRSPRMQQPATAPPPADPAPLRRPHAPPSEDPTARDGHPSRPAPPPATWYQRTFHGRADQVGREIAAHLHGCPAAADAVLIASELAGNAVTHSASAGEFFTVRCQAYPDYVW